jgi:hypothetical protein
MIYFLNFDAVKILNVEFNSFKIRYIYSIDYFSAYSTCI